jgi:hypothetical protein
MQFETIADRTKAIREKRREQRGDNVVQINLGDIIGKAVHDAVSKQMTEKDKGDDDDDEDDLPPAAIAEEAKLDEELLRKLKERRGPVSISEDPDPLEITARVPVVNIDEYRHINASDEDEARPGWLRRAWNWLRRP